MLSREMLARILLCWLLLCGVALAQPAPQQYQTQSFYALTLMGRGSDIAATTASSRQAITAAPVASVYNAGSNTAYVALGNSSVTVTAANGVPVPAGSCLSFNALGATYIAGITATGSTTLQIVTGTGVLGSCGGGSSGGGGGGGNVNITQILGSAPSVSNPLWVAPSTGASFPVTMNASPSLVNGNGMVIAQNGTVLGVTNGIYSNLLQGNVALSTGNPLFAQLTTGAATIGAVSQNGTWTVTGAGGVFPASQSGAWSVGIGSALPSGSATIGAVTQASGPWTVNGTVSNASSGVATGSVSVPSVAYNYNWNGATWDQQKSKAASTQAAFTDTAIIADPRPNSAATISGTATNPSTGAYALVTSAVAYTAGQLIANNATAGSVTNPSFSIQNSAGGAAISRLRLISNDPTSTAWAGQTVQVDLWSAAPTWTNGDRATWLPATGSASWLASFSCTFPSAEWGDGISTACSITAGNFLLATLASGTTIYASYKALTGSGVTAATQKTFTLIAEELN